MDNNLHISHKAIRKAVLKSQHCQRNFDLSRNIQEEDIELLKVAVSQCPSKQNLAFYKVHFILDRDIIEKIYEQTKGFGIDPDNYQTNSQCLANLLVLFEANSPYELTKGEDLKIRNEQVKALAETQEDTEKSLSILKRDRDQAVGIAAGYLNLTASLLGYVTGCCACFNKEKVQSILSLKNEPLLLMGIGFKDFSRNRREHHKDKNFVFPSFKKQPVEVHTIGK